MNNLLQNPDEILGMDIGIIEDWHNKKNIEIVDNLYCNIQENYDDKHIILPENELLNYDDLEFLFNKAIKILYRKYYNP